jgi:pimeloyl-ACP methyl ester carboxylesterase
MTRAAKDAAIAKLSDIRLNQSFHLESEEVPKGLGRLRVTYSDIGCDPTNYALTKDEDDHAELCVVLFIGGLVGGRFTMIRSARLARRLKIRILTIDKPGTGGSTPVPLEHRTAVHLAAIPAVLKREGVKHVTMMSHSGGAPYLIEAMLKYRGLLHSERPHTVLLSPWVHPDNSGSPLMRVTAALPSQAIAKFHVFAAFFNKAVPLDVRVNKENGRSKEITKSRETDHPEDFEIKEDIHKLVPDYISRSRNFASFFKFMPPTENAKIETGKTKNGNCAPHDAEVNAEIAKLMPGYIFAEDITGCSHDALLFLRKQPKIKPARTTDWLDHRALAVLASDQEKIIRSRENNASKLLVEAFHAESDILIGKKGARHLDQCWGSHPDTIDFKSKTVKGANHDTILDPELKEDEVFLSHIAARWYGTSQRPSSEANRIQDRFLACQILRNPSK